MAERKARLAALAAKAGRTQPQVAPEEQETAVDTNDEQPQVKFRNYVPTGNNMDMGEEEDAPSKKKARTTQDETQENKSSALEQALAKAQQEASVASNNVDMATMGPKKINWDLKRDIEPKLEKLERRTQRAIVELLRQRLEKEAAEQEDDGDEEDSDLD